MFRVSGSVFFSALAWIATSGASSAGAFLLPEGQGQFIAGLGYSEGSRRFDRTGPAVPTAPYRKAEASGYLEYGLTSWLSIIAAPTLSHETGSAASNSVTGSDSSAFGARLQLFGSASAVVAVQALVQPPIGRGSQASELADGGARSLAADLRVMGGWSFRMGGLPAFIDVEPGVRLRADPFPDEARLDLTVGVRPLPRLMLLVQDFGAFAPSDGPLIARAAYSKLQGSAVYDLSPVWSVQVGGVHTIAGRNAIRETGPFGALWYRF